MSNIYIQEPPTSGKVLLKTSVGDIDIELWTREAPKATRNFIQLCMEGYYNNTIFHRVVKGFIVQGGDPNGDGSGGESIYGAPFKDEFHTRLRFARRGLVAMANAGKDDNTSQFFFTMAATPELQNKHTIFGKVTGETVFNMLKLEEGIIDHDERPQYPNRIIKTEVLINPFTDIIPRVVQSKTKEKPKKEKRAGVKNFKLLSFGEEAEEDEELSVVANSKFSGKSKSTHDILDDPKLSSLPAIGPVEEITETPELTEEQLEQQRLEELENVRKKLKTGHSSTKVKSNKDIYEEQDDENEDLAYYLGKDKEEENKRKVEELRKEYLSVKKDFHQNKLARLAEVKETVKEQEKKSETIEEYDQTLVKYAEKQKTLPKKGTSREQFTLELLKKFKKKLDTAKEIAVEKGVAIEAPIVDEGDDNDDDTWLAHKLSFDDQPPVLARDANTKDDTWYELDDPRNPINKRRRGEDKKQSSSSKSHHKSSKR